MLKLRLLQFDEAGNLICTVKKGNFRSYADIGQYLQHKGAIGRYYILPGGGSIASIKEIVVTKDKFGKQIEMEGNLY